MAQLQLRLAARSVGCIAGRALALSIMVNNSVAYTQGVWGRNGVHRCRLRRAWRKWCLTVSAASGSCVSSHSLPTRIAPPSASAHQPVSPWKAGACRYTTDALADARWLCPSVAPVGEPDAAEAAAVTTVRRAAGAATGDWRVLAHEAPSSGRTLLDASVLRCCSTACTSESSQIAVCGTATSGPLWRPVHCPANRCCL